MAEAVSTGSPAVQQTAKKVKFVITRQDKPEGPSYTEEFEIPYRPGDERDQCIDGDSAESEKQQR